MLIDDADEIAYDLAIVAASIADGAPTCAALMREAAQALTVMTTARDELRRAVHQAIHAMQCGLNVDAEAVLQRAYLQHQDVGDE